MVDYQANLRFTGIGDLNPLLSLEAFQCVIKGGLTGGNMIGLPPLLCLFDPAVEAGDCTGKVLCTLLGLNEAHSDAKSFISNLKIL